MSRSLHAGARCRQRGIPEDLLDLVVQLGTPRSGPGGAVKYSIGKHDKGRVVSHLKELVRAVEKASSITVVAAGDGDIITCYRTVSGH